MSFNADTYKKYKTEFLNATKKVLKEKISENETKLREYENEITLLHNKVIDYISVYFENFNQREKAYYRKELVYIRDKTTLCFGKLSSKIRITTDLLQNISANILTEDEFEQNDSSNESEYSENTLMSDENQNSGTSSTESSQIANTVITNIESNSNNRTTMTLSVSEYYRMASQNINRNYGGDPLQLEPFINSVKLLQQIDTNKTHIELLKSFVISKLEGKALQIVPKDKSLDDILSALESKIKPDNSDVILGRMITLKISGMTPRVFSKEAELLADAFHRSLILEGATLDMANKMTVKQTVKMCKNNAKSAHVKSVLDSTTFKEPKEVISKLITVQDEQDIERQVLTFNRQNNFRRNGNTNNRFNNANNFNNNNQRGQGFRPNNNGWRGNNRGRGRGNHRNFGNKRNNFNVRVSENLSVPSERDGQATFAIQTSD